MNVKKTLLNRVLPFIIDGHLLMLNIKEKQMNKKIFGLVIIIILVTSCGKSKSISGQFQCIEGKFIECYGKNTIIEFKEGYNQLTVIYSKEFIEKLKSYNSSEPVKPTKSMVYVIKGDYIIFEPTIGEFKMKIIDNDNLIGESGVAECYLGKYKRIK